MLSLSGSWLITRACTLLPHSAHRYVRRDVDGKKKPKPKPEDEASAAPNVPKEGLVDRPAAPAPAAHKGEGTQAAEASKGARAAEAELEHEYIVIVAHMNVIRYFVARALQLPPEVWLRFRGDNCGITEIIVGPEGGVSLGRFADTGHLEIGQQTFH